jgi:hypothetical protein
VRSALDRESLLQQGFAHTCAQIALELHGAVDHGTSRAARALQLLTQILQEDGVPTTVTVFPPRPFFSIRSLATIRPSIDSTAAAFSLHRQSRAGQPQPGQTRPTPVE